jgi:hypothetical protein
MQREIVCRSVALQIEKQYRGIKDKISYYLHDPKELERIKVAMLDAYDEVVERGEIPSLRRILRAMPFWVNERLAVDLRKRLVEDGDIPPIARGNPKAAENGLKRVAQGPSQKEIERRKEEIRLEGLAKTRDRSAPLPSVDRMTPQEAAGWARKRYWAAWRSIQGLHLKAAVARLQDRVQSLDFKHGPRRDELFGG